MPLSHLSARFRYPLIGRFHPLNKGSRYMHLLSRAILGVGLVAGLSGTAMAASPSNGLGQAWPNAPDVSTNPNFHVYVFDFGGVRYIQVNDANGNVLGSVGSAGGIFLTLPIGRYANLVDTPSQPTALPAATQPAAAPKPVYNDGTTAITATPLSNGAMQLRAADACGDPVTCNIKVQ